MTTLADPDHSPAASTDPHPVAPRDGEAPRIAAVAAIIVALVALVAAIYLACTIPLAHLSARLERRLGRGR